jgi:RNA polymerase-associated protein
MLKRSTMTLYSDTSAYSHQVRIVLAEKGVSIDIIPVDPAMPPEDLLELNPYNTLPVLIDRDLILYESLIVMEYLDERFPHPPLLSVYPIARARIRLTVHRIERDWYSLMYKIEKETVPEQRQKHKRILLESLIDLVPVFEDTPYFLSEEFSIIDCCIAPLLLRLPNLGIHLPPLAAPIKRYMKRVFTRDSFKASLNSIEKEWLSHHAD